MNEIHSTERMLCERFLGAATSEMPVTAALLTVIDPLPAVIVTEGFEERTLGLLSALRKVGVKFPRVVISRYEDSELNRTYREQLRALAQDVGDSVEIVKNDNAGGWVNDFLASIPNEMPVLFDITCISNKALFGCLDSLSNRAGQTFVAYSEAGTYWPTRKEWTKLLAAKRAVNDVEWANRADEKEWLYGPEHDVMLVPNHEGYDAAGSKRALVAFLPFKRARLASVLSQDDYSEYLFIVGRPRLSANKWRLDALKTINESVTGQGRLEEISTFHYRETVRVLANLLLSDGSLLHKYDIHLAPLGSKLQTLGVWALSCMIPSLTIVTSVPKTYYREAFSFGIGKSWFFPLISPTKE